jgi:uncharacterized membrane protein YsdA (DUF1294 family)
LSTAFTLGSLAWLVCATALLWAAFTREGMRLPGLMAVYLAATVLASAVAFYLFASDKWRARRDQPRISERTLHLVTLAGGWPGAHLAQVLFRHKTQKLSFRAIFWLIIAVHAVIICYGIISGWPKSGLLAWLGWS